MCDLWLNPWNPSLSKSDTSVKGDQMHICIANMYICIANCIKHDVCINEVLILGIQDFLWTSLFIQRLPAFEFHWILYWREWVLKSIETYILGSVLVICSVKSLALFFTRGKHENYFACVGAHSLQYQPIDMTGKLVNRTTCVLPEASSGSLWDIGNWSRLDGSLAGTSRALIQWHSRDRIILSPVWDIQKMNMWGFLLVLGELDWKAK